nr:gluconate:H+ symporter [Virgibacillus senegalensis]
MIACVAIFLLLFFIIRTKLHAFLALMLVSIFVGLGTGMSADEILQSIQSGMGATLGFVAVIIGLGAMFGQMLEISGGAERLARTLIRKFGESKAQWALGITGFLVAIPVFFDVGLIILIPIIYKLAKKTGRSLLFYGIPLLAGLAVTHSYIPPTPGPIIVADFIHADLGWVVLFGILAGIPSMAIAGPLFGGFIAKRIQVEVPDYMNLAETEEKEDLPHFALIAVIILIPLVLMLIRTLAMMFLSDGLPLSILSFIGHPIIALLIATMLAIYFLGIRRGYGKQEVHFMVNKALEPAGIIMVVTGAGGVFKQVLIDSGIGQVLGEKLASTQLPPLILAFVIAASLRVAQGSSTVAMVTSASLIAPMLTNLSITGPMLGLIVISIASGATIFSQINDSGFWLVNRYFGMNVKDTILSWSIMETIIALVGFAMTLLLSLFI